MALDEYLEEAADHIDTLAKGKSTLRRWNGISDTDANGSGGFDCNICLGSVEDPVVTLCGHLYCWPCIYKWLDHFHGSSSEHQEHQSPHCPVCKTEVSQASLVPLYGRGQTTDSSESKCRLIPRRPQGRVCRLNTGRSTHPSTSHQPVPQFHDRYYPYASEPFNPVPSTYTSHFQRPGVSITNVFDPMFGVFGEMLYTRMFGNSVTGLYTYPNSYDLTGSGNPRVRRQVMQADRSLGRICFFLFCCTLLCLLLF